MNISTLVRKMEHMENRITTDKLCKWIKNNEIPVVSIKADFMDSASKMTFHYIQLRRNGSHKDTAVCKSFIQHGCL